VAFLLINCCSWAFDLCQPRRGLSGKASRALCAGTTLGDFRGFSFRHNLLLGSRPVSVATWPLWQSLTGPVCRDNAWRLSRFFFSSQSAPGLSTCIGRDVLRLDLVQRRKSGCFGNANASGSSPAGARLVTLAGDHRRWRWGWSFAFASTPASADRHAQSRGLKASCGGDGVDFKPCGGLEPPPNPPRYSSIKHADSCMRGGLGGLSRHPQLSTRACDLHFEFPIGP
jgi:hypothetical protein